MLDYTFRTRELKLSQFERVSTGCGFAASVRLPFSVSKPYFTEGGRAAIGVTAHRIFIASLWKPYSQITRDHINYRNDFSST